MDQRIEHPRFDERESLTNKLNDGELATWKALRDGLSPEWEIYAQSHILDVMPDFVLVNPEKGVFIVEVKDVDLSSRHTKWIANEVDSARIQTEVRYKDAISRLPGGVSQFKGGALRACVVFTRTKVVDADRLIRGRCDRITPVFTGGEMVERMISAIEATSIRENQVNSPAFAALRHFLVEPEFVREQRELPLVSALSPKQREIVMNPEGVRRRRVKGGAGSGKTIVLAARAAELAKNPDCRILVICFNRSLVTYLRDTIAEYTRRSGGNRKSIIIYHWDQWWSDSYWVLDKTDQSQCNVPIGDRGRVARQVLEAGAGINLPRFDAVLIDEAQDLSPDQIGALTTVLRDGDSELLVCFDGAQDVYGRSEAWSDGAFLNLGFRGPFFQLKENRRMPPRVATIANYFAETLLNVPVEDLLDVPVMETLEDHVAEINWIQCDDLDLVPVCMREVAALFDDGVPRSRDLVAWADLVIASRLRETALKIKSALEGQELKVISAVHGELRSREDQNAKSSFYKGDGRIKVSTIRSLKGFETTATVIAVEPFETTDVAGALREVYTALTRLKGRTRGSSLVVVCAEPSLREFGEYFNQVR